ncbi:MAG: hypothetical protein PHS14_06365 [Elusimicrobia bacterium]|nr:hypothetical protein [Elusimicrobiota bacterium]
MALSALAFLLMAAPAFADQPAPAPAPQAFVDPATLKARAEALRDAVADQSVSDISVKSRAYGFFDKLPEERLVVAAGNYRRMDREPVTGKAGSIEGMQEAADKRIAEWKRTHAEPPPPDLMATVAQALALKEGKSLSYDAEGRLAPNQMGIFKYMRDRLDGGMVKLNERMKLLAVMVGDAFTYATVAHEARHSLDRAAGRLTPEQEVAGEVSAFRTQYLWLKLMDPSGERMLTLHGSLKMWMLREPDDKIKAALGEAVVYLEHLSDVVSTNGKEDELKKLVEKLGYSDGHDHDHDGDEHKGRGAALPTSA